MNSSNVDTGTSQLRQSQSTPTEDIATRRTIGDLSEDGSPDIPEINNVRRSVSTPTEDRRTPTENDDYHYDDEDEIDYGDDIDVLNSPWSNMMGGTGDVGFAQDQDSYLLSDDDDEVFYVDDISEDFDDDLYGDDYDDLDVTDDHEQEKNIPSYKRQGRGESGTCTPPFSTSSLSLTGVQFSPDTSKNTSGVMGAEQWSWFVADLVQSLYGEKMNKLKNDIKDRLRHFRSQTRFLSVLKFKPEPLQEDDVAMPPLFLRV